MHPPKGPPQAENPLSFFGLQKERQDLQGIKSGWTTNERLAARQVAGGEG